LGKTTTNAQAAESCKLSESSLGCRTPGVSERELIPALIRWPINARSDYWWKCTPTQSR